MEIRNDWYKQTYTYTHGYGAVVSPVNEIDNGKPNMYIQGLPPIEYKDEWEQEHRFIETPGPAYLLRRTHESLCHRPS